MYELPYAGAYRPPERHGQLIHSCLILKKDLHVYDIVLCVFSKLLASNQALPLRAQLFKRRKMKEGESLEDLDHVLDMDDVFWTWFSISGRYRPRTATANANYDSAVFCVNDRRSECTNHPSAD